MSKRFAIITIILVLLVGTGALYFLLGGKAPSGIAPITSFLPFGKAPDQTDSQTGGTDNNGASGSGTTNGGTNSDGTSAAIPQFFKLSDTPVAGFVSFVKNGSTIVRTVDRATGHVTDVNPATLFKTQILNTTEPKVYKALFKSDGSGYIMRSLPGRGEAITNTSIALTAPKSTSTAAVYTAQATLLRGSIGEMAVTPNGSLIYNLTDSGIVGFSSFSGEKPKVLLNLPFTNWRIEDMNDASALIYTKASSASQGFAYTMNLSNGSLTKVLGPLPALTVLPSPDSKRLAYSHRDSGAIVLSSLNLANKITLDISPTTLPEKCVWSKKVSSQIICGAPIGGLGTNAPDTWYKGELSYSDQIWRFNTDTDTAEILIDPVKNFDTTIDAVNLTLSPNEDYLFFINKIDLTLWALKLVS